MKKVTKKTTKKTVIPTPDYVIDITNDFTVEDVKRSIADAKASYYLTCDNADGIINIVLDSMFENNNIIMKLPCGEYIADKVEFNVVDDTLILTPTGLKINIVKKKPNIFKRFWNWITRKK